MSGINCSIAGATYQAPTPTFAVAAAGGATSVNEGSSLTFNVTGTNIVDGTYFFAVNTNAIDFSPSSGSFTITSNTGSFSLTPTADVTTEGAETFTVSVRTVSTSGTIVATSASITINDTSVAPSYAIATAGGVTSINEGSNLTFNVTTTNVPNGTTLYWAVNFGSAVAGDFSSTSGSFTITSNAGSFVVGPVADLTTEGPEAFSVSVGTGPSVGATTVVVSGSITINDTSTTPVAVYTVTPAAASVNEGSSLTFNVGGSNIVNGTYYWTVQNNTTANADFSAVSGSFTITSNVGSLSVTTVADATTEGAQTFSVAIRSGSISGTILQTSSLVTINDTSTAPSFAGVDANAGTLRLALPFNSTYGLDDVSHLYSNRVNTSPCVRAGPVSSAVIITTSSSKFYGSSAFGQRGGNAMIYTLPVNLVMSNAFLLEFWARANTTSSNNWLWADGYSARELAVGPYNGGSLPGALSVNNGNGRIGGVGTAFNHYAFSNGSWWFNGVRRGTPNYGAAGWSFNQLRVMQQENGDGNNFLGWVNDFRLYIGSNKYGTSNFTPPGQLA